MNLSKLNDFLESVFRFLASLKLAVTIIISIAVLSAIGTFLEARYDATYAQKVIYLSPYMFFVLAMLCVNLINVMVDRLPWKPHHTGFILAHVGIITLILGSLVTHLKGVDGSMPIGVGERNRYVMLPSTEFAIYSSFGTGNWEKMYGNRTDFFLRPPRGEEFTLGEHKVKILDHYIYARVDDKLVASTDKNDTAAFRVQLQNDRVNMTQWIIRDPKSMQDTLDLGPAKVIVIEGKYTYQGGNELVLRPLKDSAKEEFEFEVYTRSKGGQTKRGSATAGETIDLGWMGLQLRVLKYLPHARQKTEYIKLDRPMGETTTSALKVSFDEKEHWLGLNANVRIFTESNVFLLGYQNQRLDVGFDIQLDNFSIGRYQGTMRAASYASDVSLDEIGKHHISMNEPLKHRGFTFYQASFAEDASGKPTTSILSVNRDPGRFMKYLGSFLIVLGSVVMFYFKRYRMKIFGSKESP